MSRITGEPRLWRDDMKPWETRVAKLEYCYHQREVHRELSKLHNEKAREFTEEIKKQEAKLHGSRLEEKSWA